VFRPGTIRIDDVIPAKAGIQFCPEFRACLKLDSRLRGNDAGEVGEFIDARTAA
jgi:hypothetical protein